MPPGDGIGWRVVGHHTAKKKNSPRVAFFRLPTLKTSEKKQQNEKALPKRGDFSGLLISLVAGLVHRLNKEIGAARPMIRVVTGRRFLTGFRPHPQKGVSRNRRGPDA